jgi:ribose transport system substrate-binding protein
MLMMSLAACGDKKDDDAAADDAVKGEIAVLVPSADHGWTGAVLKYAKEEADAMEGDITAKVYAATDPKEQSQQIDDLLAQKTPPVGIVILPYDNTLESAMAKVASSDIPFVMFDRIIDNAAVQEKVIANVKGDNEGIGKATAERFVEQGLQPGDKVYVMIGDTSSVPEMRNKGFEEGLKDAGWSDEQIDTVEYSGATGWSRSEGKKIFIDWINAKSVDQIGEYHYIFTHDDEIGMGILEALSGTEIEQTKKDAFLTSVISLGTSSGLDEMYQVLKGEHSNAAYHDIIKNFDLFSVTYDPAMIKQAIQDMVRYLDGDDVAKDDTIAVDVVDATNVNDYQGF